ncbi:hypothetical protein JYB87_11815 [Shewanella avicenniae]|uniref:Uncharacterized protein n=1 Tax=Shewanella avicenniae TaxID=2814294 RepID=A0ABX7QP01_9GAMM|nr:hypothetical protein [Shewanella avicenniae]QSX32453.1 hypothetical protein JYB87_11815 [Shewanella avicenniae]
MFDFFPDITPSTSAFAVIPAAEARFNNFSKVETVFDKAGDKWEATLSWNFIKRADVRTLRGFLNKQGGTGRFYVRDTAHQNEGAWGGGIVVNGASQYGKMLTISGATPNAEIAPIADRFTLDGFLYELTDTATADANGEAKIYFTPELRRSPLQGTALITADPYGTFMLRDPSEIPTFSQNRLGARGVRLSLIEAIRL